MFQIDFSTLVTTLSGNTIENSNRPIISSNATFLYTSEPVAKTAKITYSEQFKTLGPIRLEQQ